MPVYIYKRKLPYEQPEYIFTDFSDEKIMLSHLKPVCFTYALEFLPLISHGVIPLLIYDPDGFFIFLHGYNGKFSENYCRTYLIVEMLK